VRLSQIRSGYPHYFGNLLLSLTRKLGFDILTGFQNLLGIKIPDVKVKIIIPNRFWKPVRIKKHILERIKIHFYKIIRAEGS
jgi:hypothetical protein